MMRKVALDWDGTTEPDQKGMGAIVRCFQSLGYKIYIVTLRSEEHDFSNDLKEFSDKYGIEIIFCDGKSKKLMSELKGINFDFWIDDMPECIDYGSKMSPLEIHEWRNTL